jgi:lipopolysaccharide transport system ATP-binding protein
MTDTVIRVENLSKLYRIGKAQERHDTLRDALMSGLRAPLGWLRRNGRDLDHAQDIIWALKNVSLEVKYGEVVGIIGRNGAGKSTLLKILSRITEPTEGRAVIRGRVGSLLEVGTGFHEELTGRENIYMSGAILGMRKAEIDRKFDEIVDFSGVERFIDTPFKRFSSGMRVRLGFSVAAHLEPEILLIDEVLAVGDAAFQKKCLGKMGDVAREGRTVLFVSHNMVALQNLCPRAIWLHEGQIKGEGEATRVVSDYLQSNFASLPEHVWDDVKTAPGNDIVRLHQVRARPQDGSPSDPITMQTPVSIEVEYWNLVPDARLHVTLHVYTAQQVVAFSTGSSSDPAWQGRPFPAGLFRSVCQIPGNFLNSGLHRVYLLVIQNGDTAIYRHEDVLSFDVLDTGKRRGAWFGKEPGVVRPTMKWTTEHLDSAPVGE